jgi:CSLREA domain-containing protein
MTVRRLCGAVLTVAALALPATVHAAAITVTTTADPGTAAQCSLRQAITAANTDAAPPSSSCTAGSDADVITVPANAQPYKLLLGGTPEDNNASGDLDVKSNVEIVGAGRTATVVDGNGIDRVLDVLAGATTVTVRALTVTGGHARDGADGADGQDATGGGNVDAHGASGTGGADGGGIRHASGTLTLDDVVVRSNAAGAGGSGGKGGIGVVTNPATGGSGAVGGDGGAILAQAPLVVSDSLIEGNAAGDSGSGGNAGTSAAGFNSLDPGEDARGGDSNSGGDGGGIAAQGALADVTINDSIIRDNRAGDGGTGGKGGQAGAGGSAGAGGISRGGTGGDGGHGGGIWSGGDLQITGSVISDNAAGDARDGGDGGKGGVGNGAAAGGASRGGNGGQGGWSGGIEANDGLITITTSEIADNNTGDGGDGGAGGQGGFSAATSGSSLGAGGVAPGRGGGLVLLGTAHGSVTNTTIALNTTGAAGDGGDGGTGPLASTAGSGGSGGVGAGVAAAGSQLTTFEFVTVAGNTLGAAGRPGRPGTGATANAAGPGAIAVGGGFVVGANSVLLRRSVVVGNAQSQCTGAYAPGSGDVIADPGIATCPSSSGDPFLGPFTLHGGLSRTFVPGAGSAALDAITSGCPAKDQRGLSRTKDGACDLGAVERSVPIVTTGAASDLTASGATLAGTVDPNELDTTYRFDYGTTAQYGSSTAASSASGNTATAASSTLTGLAPGTTYHYRVRAVNADGTTTGRDATFTTATPPPPPGGENPPDVGTTPPPPPLVAVKRPFAGVKAATGRIRLDAKGKAAVKLTCPAATVTRCTGTLTLTRVLTVKKGRKRVKKTQRIGSARFTISAGRSAVVKVTILASARRKLVSATATTAAKDAGGTAKTLTSKLTLLPAKKAKKPKARH